MGNEVLVLLTMNVHPLKAKFQEPYKVVRKVSNELYVSTPARRKKTRNYQINMLKQYFRRSEEM